MKKVLMIVGALTLIAVFGCFAMTTMGIWSIGSAVNEAQSAPGGSAETAVEVGETVTVDDLEYRVLEASKATTLKDRAGLFDDMTTQGEFVVVRYGVTNRGERSNSVWLVNLEDDKGRSFQSTTTMEGFVPDGEYCIFETMNPGMSSTCAKVFETPPDATGLMLHVSSLGIAGGYVRLGLE